MRKVAQFGSRAFDIRVVYPLPFRLLTNNEIKRENMPNHVKRYIFNNRLCLDSTQTKSIKLQYIFVFDYFTVLNIAQIVLRVGTGKSSAI